jgi:fructokinase
MGELLIDFVSVTTGTSIKDAPAFTKAPGGAPANVAVGVRRLGRTSGFIGKVGRDDFGLFLGETLAREGVDTRGVRYEDKARTMLAFVSLRPDGEREFMFYRHPSADMLLDPGEVDASVIREARVFHHGSISLITEPSRSATLAAVEAARASGALVSYDPNLRLPLWPTPDEARATILAAARWADLIKVSEEELAFLTGADDVADGVRRLRRAVPAECAIVVTRGRLGCALAVGGPSGRSECGGLWLEVPGFDVRTVDTTGAGDAFVAGLLVGLVDEAAAATSIVGAQAASAGVAPREGVTPRQGVAEVVGDAEPVSRGVASSGGRGGIDKTKTERAMMTPTSGVSLRMFCEAQWRRALTLANAVGALCTTKLGAIPALPTMDEVRTFLANVSNERAGRNVPTNALDE